MKQAYTFIKAPIPWNAIGELDCRRCAFRMGLIKSCRAAYPWIQVDHKPHSDCPYIKALDNDDE